MGVVVVPSQEVMPLSSQISTMIGMAQNTYYEEKRALITGGSEGIGLAIAKALVQARVHVTIASRDAEKQRRALDQLESQRQTQNQRIAAITVDVTDAADVERHVNRLCEQQGVLDFLVNSAGHGRPGYLEELSIPMIRQMMEANFFGIVHATKSAWPHFLRAGKGHIVNVSSMAGLFGLFGYTGYCASKYAAIGFSEALRREAAPFGIRVSVLCPPNTRTPGLEKENQHKPPEVLKTEEKVKTIAPEVVAQALLKALPSNPSVVIPTLDGRWAWRAARYFPWLADLLLKRPLN